MAKKKKSLPATIPVYPTKPTAFGDGFILQWCLLAEDFVPIEKVGRLGVSLTRRDLAVIEKLVDEAGLGLEVSNNGVERMIRVKDRLSGRCCQVNLDHVRTHTELKDIVAHAVDTMLNVETL